MNTGTSEVGRRKAEVAESMRSAVDHAVDELKKREATGEVSGGYREDWKAEIRLGQVETVQGSTTRGLRITAYGDSKRSGTTSISEIDIAAVHAAAAKAVELSRYGDPDQWAGLPPRGECGVAGGDLDLDDPGYAKLDREALLRQVIEAEKIALASDPRITNAHRSSVHAGRSEHWYASTDGVFVHRTGTTAGYSVVVVAQDAGGERQSGGYGTYARRVSALKDAGTVGREAGTRAVRHFGWKPAPTGRFPVLYDQDVASELLGGLASAVAGSAIYRGSSYLAGRLGDAVASPVVTVSDDPLIPGALGSRPCDGEGVRARRLTLIDAGRLATYLVGGYAARRLAHPYTGHDGGCSNLRLAPGKATRADLLRELGTGLLAQELHGFGVDLASGTYSKGVSGFWIENGAIAHPVQEATIAGNLMELWQGIRLVGDDPLDESAISSPSLLIDGFTIAGKS